MKKEYVTYGILGVVAGLILGFFVANWTFKGPTAGAQAQSTDQRAASVNGGGANQQLPPNHPPIDSGQTIPAAPLPDLSGGAPTPPSTPSGETAALPSLEPLPPSSKEKRVEQDKKNIQVLKGIPADRLTPIMFAFKNSLGVDCTYCHVKDQFEK